MCKRSCKKWAIDKPTIPSGTVRQTIVATIPTTTSTNNQRSAPRRPYIPTGSFNHSETVFSADNNLIFGNRDIDSHRNERSTVSDAPFQGYDFSRRIEINNHSTVRDVVISVDPAPRYVGPRAPELTPESVHGYMNSKAGFKPYDNDGLPTYEEVIEMNHQSR